MIATLQILAAEAPNGKHLAGDINEVIWGSIAFFVVVGLIWWKAGPAIKKAIADAKAKQAAELSEAADVLAAAEARQASAGSSTVDVDAEGERIVAQAREAAVSMKADLIARAEAEVVSLRERAAADIASSRSQAEADLSAEVTALTLGAAESVVSHNLDAAAQRDLVEAYISQVGAS